MYFVLNEAQSGSVLCIAYRDAFQCVSRIVMRADKISRQMVLVVDLLPIRSPTTFGVFYPTHDVFASFPSFENAGNAAKTLQAAGYVESVATSATETVRFMNEIRAKSDCGTRKTNEGS